MEDLKKIIGNNITALRTSAKLTQSELADKLNYSDKSVSKWERGESAPDIFILKQIADIFGVMVDYLLLEEHCDDSLVTKKMLTKRSRYIITALYRFAYDEHKRRIYRVFGGNTADDDRSARL